MKELTRLLKYSRPYVPHLSLSVLLMMCVGAAQGLTALLIGPIFDRVLNPQSADAPVLLSKYPKPIYLTLPHIHNVWTMIAVAILAVAVFAVLWLRNRPVLSAADVRELVN